MSGIEKLLDVVASMDGIKSREPKSLISELDKRLGNGGKTAQVLETMFNLYREVINSVDDLIILYDNLGNIIKVNASCERITGYTREQLKTMSIDQLMPDNINSKIKEGIISRFTEFDNGVRTGYFLVNLQRNPESDYKNKTLFFEVNARRISEGSDDNALYVLCGRNISKRKKLELELKKKNELLRDLNKKLEQTIITDELTGLYNRRYFENRFQQECKRIARTQGYFSIMFFDFDDFKQFNDLFSHQVGDYVLKYASNLLQDNLRNYTLIARWGGDEFAALLSRTSVDEALNIGKRVISYLNNNPLKFNSLPIPKKLLASTYETAKSNNLLEGDNLRITVSVGVGSTEHSSVDQIFGDVDTAMYAAKSHGKNQVVAYRRTR